MVEIEKILEDVTVTEYCASLGKEIKNFDLRSVRYAIKIDSSMHLERLTYENVLDRFVKIVPADAVAVVNYKYSSNSATYARGIGTALIPKD